MIEFDADLLFDSNTPNDILAEQIRAFLAKGGTGSDFVILILRNRKPGISQHVSRLLTLMSDVLAESGAR
jgi:hypothetical protein